MSPAECFATRTSSPPPTSNPQQADTTHECPTTHVTSQPTIMAGLLPGGNDSPYAPNNTTTIDNPSYIILLLLLQTHSDRKETENTRQTQPPSIHSLPPHLIIIRLTSQSQQKFGHGLRPHVRNSPPSISPSEAVPTDPEAFSGCQLRRPSRGAPTHSCAGVIVPCRRHSTPGP